MAENHKQIVLPVKQKLKSLEKSEEGESVIEWIMEWVTVSVNNTPGLTLELLPMNTTALWKKSDGVG
jgi:hypothetical protein